MEDRCSLAFLLFRASCLRGVLMGMNLSPTAERSGLTILGVYA